MAIADPGFVDDVVAETTILPEWGDAIRDRAWQRFTTAASRDSAITSPLVGQMAVLTQSGQSGIYQFVGPTLGWTQPWNAPWGLLGTSNITASQTGIGASTAISGLSVAVQPPAHRWVKIEVQGRVQKNTLGQWTVSISDGTVARVVGGDVTDDGHSVSFSGYRLDNSDGTAITYTVSAIGNTNAGTVDAVASTANQWRLNVIDLGPQGAPS